MPIPKDNLLFGYEPCLTKEQREFVDAIFDYQCVIVNSKAGTGKTSLAVACAKLLNQPLYFVFSPVEENSLGFTPGDVQDKEAKYLTPLYDALYEINEDPKKAIFNEDDPEQMKRGEFWVFPKSHVFLRGSNIKNATVIIEEAQNFTKSELRKTLSRIHDSCTVIIIGHEGQIDLENPRDSGFRRLIEHFEQEDYVKVCQLTHNWRGKLAQKADTL